MSITGLEQLSNDLKASQELREQFASDPDSVLNDPKYGLTDEEKKTVKQAADDGWVTPLGGWIPPTGA